MKMKALIIGAAGFVGKYLISHLSDAYPWELHATKLAHEGLDTGKAQVWDLNIMDKENIAAVLTQIRPDYIFYLAAQSSVALSWKNPELTVDINIKGCLNLFNVLRELNQNPRILLIGSGEEYGYIRPDQTPVGETTPLNPGNIYAATKACQNMLGTIYARAYDLNIILVRAFNHIGPEQAPIFVVSDFCRQVARIEELHLEPVIRVGNLEACRDFTDVRDVVRYINSMAAELEHNAQPDFLLEKQAVSDYIFRHEWKRNIPIYREGEHKFSYISRKDRKPQKVTVTCSLEDLPSGYTAEQAEQHGKLYVFGMEQPIPNAPPVQKKLVQRKGRER